MLAFLALPKGSAIDHGVSQASEGSALDDGVHDDEPFDEVVEEAHTSLEEMLGEIMEGFFDNPDDLDELVRELDGEEPDAEGEDDAEALGVAYPEAVGLDPEILPDHADVPVDFVDDEFVAVAESAEECLALPLHDAPDGVHPAAGSSGDCEPPPEVWVDGIHISALGYVRCSRAGFDPVRVIGFVSYRGDMSSIFANCHLHPACSVSAGIRRNDVPREHMASWLAMGEVVDKTLPRPERLMAGTRHRTVWKKPAVAVG